MVWLTDLGWWEERGGQGQCWCMPSPHRTVCPKNWNVRLTNTFVVSMFSPQTPPFPLFP